MVSERPAAGGVPQQPVRADRGQDFQPYNLFHLYQGYGNQRNVGFRLTYDNPSTGETEELYAEKTVPIENYSDEWYYQRDVNRVLNLVSSTYRGNYTTAYAVNNDYETL